MSAPNPPEAAQDADYVAPHEHVYVCQDCGEIGRAPVDQGPRKRRRDTPWGLFLWCLEQRRMHPPR